MFHITHSFLIDCKGKSFKNGFIIKMETNHHDEFGNEYLDQLTTAAE